MMSEVERGIAIRHHMAAAAANTVIDRQMRNSKAREMLHGTAQAILREFGPITVAGMAEAETIRLGFQLWDEATRFRLLPVWLYPFLALGQELHTITGRTAIVGPNYNKPGLIGFMSAVSKAGHLEWGFVPSDCIPPAGKSN